MKGKHSINPRLAKGPQATYKIIALLLAEHRNALEKATRSTDRRKLKAAIATLNDALATLRTKNSKQKRPRTIRLREIDTLTDRERMMAKLGREAGHGCDVIYHGTRHLTKVLRDGKLIPPRFGETEIFFSRSPETAA